MIKTLLASSTLIAAALLAGPAAAAPSWSDIGKDQLATYGMAELYIGKITRSGDHRVTGELHARLDTPWEDPNASGAYNDIYFKVLADCSEQTVGIMPTWPDGPDEPGVPSSYLRRPVPGSVSAKLLKAYCG